ncbi:MAG: Sec-independent protein translocase protein TatB [Desulfosarcinaceae bacterium]|nr:Sec-independent protein translocase protein TatB [Desulfosarcinaceae bacterium]
MFGIGMPELILILAVALIVIGPKKLPDLAKSLGKAMGEFKKATNEIKDSMQLDSGIQEVKTSFKDLERELKKPVETPPAVESPAPTETVAGAPTGAVAGVPIEAGVDDPPLSEAELEAYASEEEVAAGEEVAAAEGTPPDDSDASPSLPTDSGDAATAPSPAGDPPSPDDAALSKETPLQRETSEQDETSPQKAPRDKGA